jgi:hypothetical protein
MQDRLERIESIKAGSLSGLTAGIAYGAIELAERWLGTSAPASIFNFGTTATIAIASGFLFGVTYRYIIRTDRNDHLNSGAVMAFGLVRGLARVNLDRLDLVQIELAGIDVIKSIILFAIARFALDFALQAAWIAPFGRDFNSTSIEPVNSQITNQPSRDLVRGDRQL